MSISLDINRPTPNFNRVMLSARALQPGNVWISAHPFAPGDGYHMHSASPIWRHNYAGEDMPQYLSSIADRLWNELPGLSLVAFTNGQIVIHHNQLFDDDDIATAACNIIRPALEEQALLNNL